MPNIKISSVSETLFSCLLSLYKLSCCFHQRLQQILGWCFKVLLNGPSRNYSSRIKPPYLILIAKRYQLK
jgi:hypothetical protein